ncbi:hypothetical protein HDV63DRAFT_390739 [Trichoderma sp. SZMC 28014]
MERRQYTTSYRPIIPSSHHSIIPSSPTEEIFWLFEPKSIAIGATTIVFLYASFLFHLSKSLVFIHLTSLSLRAPFIDKVPGPCASSFKILLLPFHRNISPFDASSTDFCVRKSFSSLPPRHFGQLFSIAPCHDLRVGGKQRFWSNLDKSR